MKRGVLYPAELVTAVSWFVVRVTKGSSKHILWKDAGVLGSAATYTGFSSSTSSYSSVKVYDLGAVKMTDFSVFFFYVGSNIGCFLTLFLFFLDS